MSEGDELDRPPATLRFGISGIGLLGPGLADWAGAQSLLVQPSGYTPAPTVLPTTERLPPTERRRAGAVVKASVVVAERAVAMAGADPATLATVFASSTADPLNCHVMCETLATAPLQVSPTRFTNSVHNAAAGTWHIAVNSRAPSTSLAAHDDSFAAALLEAALQCVASARPVLLVACDLPYPEPMHTLRPVADIFGCALLLTPPAAPAAWTVALDLTSPQPASVCDGAALDAVRQQIPTARALPLLQALARAAAGGAGGAAHRVVLPAQDGIALALEVQAR
ncbi:MAG: beta-ketoacyl synthase chain length factor [Rubrivivax sp.]